MQYVGIDWAYRYARWCALSERGEVTAEATMPADEDGLVCIACGHLISADHHRIEIHGAHEHTFVNPGGFVHQWGLVVGGAN